MGHFTSFYPLSEFVVNFLLMLVEDAKRKKNSYAKELSDVTLMQKVSEYQFHEKCVIVVKNYF